MTRLFNRTNLIFLAGIVVVVSAYLYYKAPKFINGEGAPDFVSYTPDGDSIQLSSLKGNIVLLDFWGSWCGPCRNENPDLVRLYDKYHGKSYKKADDFLILSVALERSKNAWIRAIETDGLKWKTHVSSLKRMRDPIAKLYGVNEIPTKYLLNENGVIVAVNPSFEELAAFLDGRVE